MESLQKIELFNMVVVSVLREYSNGCPHGGTRTSFREGFQLLVIVKLSQDNGDED